MKERGIEAFGGSSPNLSVSVYRLLGMFGVVSRSCFQALSISSSFLRLWFLSFGNKVTAP